MKVAAMDAVTNGAYDQPIDDAKFNFKVAITGFPYSKYLSCVIMRTCSTALCSVELTVDPS